MKKSIWLALCAFILVSCNKTEDEKAATLLSEIKTLYENGDYSQALDSIVSLRNKFSKAIESRQQALKIWQEASLKIAQQDIALTDSALQATLRAIPLETNLYKANMMRVKRDSLKARYEAMCGVVRMIRLRQKQTQE